MSRLRRGAIALTDGDGQMPHLSDPSAIFYPRGNAHRIVAAMAGTEVPSAASISARATRTHCLAACRR